MEHKPWYRSPLFLSAVLGLLGLVLSPLTLSYSQPPFRLTIVWSYVFPLMAALAYGPKGALAASFLGLAFFFPILVWPVDGWAAPMVSVGYVFWFWIQGETQKIRKRTRAFWNHPALVQVGFALAYGLLIRVGYPLAFSFNPPFWNSNSPNFIDPRIVDGIVVKAITIQFFILFAAMTLLRVNIIRQILGLKKVAEYRENGKIFMVTVASFGGLWYLVTVFTRIFVELDIPAVFVPQYNLMSILSLFAVVGASFIAAYIFCGYVERRLAAEDRYRETLENLPIPLGLSHKDGRISYINHSFYQVFGYSLAEIDTVEKWALAAYPDPEKRDVARQSWSQTLAQSQKLGIPVSTENTFIAKDGSSRSVIITSRFSDDKILSTFQDVTREKRLMEEVENTQRLESLGLLAGGIAHDFNNLMAGLFGNLQLAQMVDDPHKQKEYLDNSLGLLKRTQGLTQQLLTFAHGGSPAFRLEQVGGYLKKTAEFALSGSSVELQTQIRDELWSCYCDLSQLGQVVDNLVINARQAMEEVGIITLKAWNTYLREGNVQKLPPGNYVGFSVQDQGSGINTENLGKIFDPFFSTKSSGRGLGLSTCYSIIQKHGGSLEVESTLGKGTTFFIFLPAVRSSPRVIPESDPKNQIADSKDSTLQTLGTVLVVDDEAYIREILIQLLSQLGYRTLGFSHGEETLEFLAELGEGVGDIRIALLDLTIPGKMGGALLGDSMAQKYPHIRRFVISGYANDPALSNPTEHGFEGALRKPFSLTDLKDLLTGG